MNPEELHKVFLDHQSQTTDWFMSKTIGFKFPVYMSVDVRDAGFKLAAVDANAFPAGFNNVCDIDRENAPDIFKNYMEKNYQTLPEKILLLTEENTKNRYYWDNVHAILTMIESAGFSARVSFPKELNEDSMVLESASGKNVTVYSAKRREDHVVLSDGFVPDFIMSNNDFTTEYKDWFEGLETPINPPHELGWWNRSKGEHFKFYNEFANELASLLDIDPWTLSIKTEVFDNFDVGSESNRMALADKVETLLDKIKKKYAEEKIEYDAAVFVKNNSGTYGMGVTQVKSGEDIVKWNNKTRTKMKAAKGGGGISQLVLQEGIPSRVQSESSAAEPVIYSIGCELVGGFLRTHGSKSALDNLNSPGAIFKRLCMSDLKIDIDGCLMENIYGWVSRLSLLSLSREAEMLNSKFIGFNENPAGCR